MLLSTPPLTNLKQFTPSRRGKRGLNAQEDLRKRFIFLIKTDRGSVRFKLIYFQSLQLQIQDKAMIYKNNISIFSWETETFFFAIDLQWRLNTFEYFFVFWFPYLPIKMLC